MSWEMQFYCVYTWSQGTEAYGKIFVIKIANFQLSEAGSVPYLMMLWKTAILIDSIKIKAKTPLLLHFRFLVKNRANKTICGFVIFYKRKWMFTIYPPKSSKSWAKSHRTFKIMKESQEYEINMIIKAEQLWNVYWGHKPKLNKDIN